MDTKFSVALHVLIYLSETEALATSQSLADSVQTNASHIRKIIGLLRGADLVTSQQGKSGFHLAKAQQDITLAMVYRAVYPNKALLHVHEDPNSACPVGQYIEEVLEPTFAQIEDSLLASLEKQTLAQMVDQFYQKIREKEENR